MTEKDDIISVEDAARLIGISPQAVREALRSGKIIGKRLGRPWAVSQKSALAYKEEYERRELAKKRKN